MSNISKEVESLLKDFGMTVEESCWYSKVAKKWIISHKAVEKIGDLAGVTFPDFPTILEGNGDAGVVTLMGWAKREERQVWTLGEASPRNNKNGYPWAMAEKRLKDRLILKLVFSGLHGDIYSEIEADWDKPIAATKTMPRKEEPISFDECVPPPKPKATMGRKSQDGPANGVQTKILATLRELAKEEQDSKDKGYEWKLGDTDESWESIFQAARDETRGNKTIPQASIERYKAWLQWAERW